MASILIIGLDNLSKKIILHAKKVGCKVMGFDFDIDITASFFKQKLIENDPNIILNDLLKKADAIILNTELAKYAPIFRLVPFIKSDCLILDTRIYKGKIEQIKKSLGIRGDNFMSCNFTPFPDEVVITHDNNVRLALILAVSNFFNDLKIKTSTLKPLENDRIFANLYQIPYFLDKILFKSDDLHFVTSNSDFANYSFFFEDITLNKNNIIKGIHAFLDGIPNGRDTKAIKSIIKDHNNLLKPNNKVKKEITDEAVFKIIFEKIFIKTCVPTAVEYYVDFNFLNFDYAKYDMNEVENYLMDNKDIFEISITILKEKIINLSSLLQFEDMPLAKFIKILNNI